MLDRLRPTATGLDGIPAWFVRLGAPIFATPIAQLFNQSITDGIGVVPREWKMAIITPVPKVSKPSQPCDFRPISITSVLSRTFKRNIVKSYIPSTPRTHSWTLLWLPIRFQTDWFHHSERQLSLSVLTEFIVNESLCPSLCSGLFKGFRHSAARHTDGKDGKTTGAGPDLQLDQRFL